MEDELARWESFNDSLAWQTGQLHRTVFVSFVRARSLGVKRGWALDIVLSRLTSLGFKFRGATIADQCQRAYREEVHVGMPPTRPKLQREPLSLEILVKRGYRAADMFDHSPWRCSDDDIANAEYGVDVLFGATNPLICVGRTAFDFWTAARN